MKKHYKILVSIILIISLIAGGLTFYFINRRDKIDIFNYLSIKEYGADTKGTIYVSSDKEKVIAEITDQEIQEKLLVVLDNIAYSFDKKENLSNKDIVTISIDTNNPTNNDLLNQYKITPIQKSLEYTITKLLVIPTWDELSMDNKNEIDGLIQESVTQVHDYFYDLQKTNYSNKFGKDIPLVVSEKLEGIYYFRDFEYCHILDLDAEKLEYRLNSICGRAVYIYSYDYHIPDDNYYRTSNYTTNYFIHEVTNIYSSDVIEKNYFSYTNAEFGWSNSYNFDSINESYLKNGFERIS